MASSANFIATPQMWQAAIPATANTNRDGTGTITTVVTAAATGSRVDRLTITATGTTTAGMLRVFTRVSAGTWRLLREIPVAAGTPSGTAPAQTYTVETAVGSLVPAFLLGPTDELGVATNNAEAFTAVAIGGDF